MNTTDAASPRFRIAIVLSIAVHLCALLLLATLAGEPRFASSSARETSGLIAITTIERRTVAPTPHPIYRATIAAPAPLVAPHVAAAGIPRRFVTTVSKPAARRARSVAPFSRHVQPVALGEAAAVGEASSPPRRAIAFVAPLPTSTPTPMPTAARATPEPTTAPTTAPATPAPVVAANFGGLFSQNYPPAIAAPADLARIRARLDGPVRIRIEVDETGHATDVRFLHPLADDGLAQEIRSALLAMHYVPADCNGLHCDGTLDIAF